MTSPRAVRPHDAYTVAQRKFYEICRIRHRNAFGDDHDELDTGFDGFHHRILGESRRNEHHGGHRSRSGLGFGTGRKNVNGGVLAIARRRIGNIQTGLACIDAADDIGSRLQHSRGMHHALMPCDALNDNRGIIFDEQCHQLASFADEAMRAAS